MTKLGRSYERVLYDFIKKISPNSNVTHGAWVDGPDGAREIDVLIEAKINGEQIKLLMECKDYSKKRRLGIGVVDAFESKLKDMNATGGAICSNADFSQPARNKAKRLSIGLIGLLKNNLGTGYEVQDTLERIEIQGSVNNFSLDFQFERPFINDPKALDMPLFSSCSLKNMAAYVFMMGVVMHPVVNGRPSFRYTFHDPWPFFLVNNNSIKELIVSGRISGVWLQKKTKISADDAIYKWLSRDFLLAPGNQSVTFHDATFDDPKYWIQKSQISSSEVKDGDISLLMRNVGLYGFARESAGISEILSKLNVQSIELTNSDEKLGFSESKNRYVLRYAERISQQRH